MLEPEEPPRKVTVLGREQLEPSVSERTVRATPPVKPSVPEPYGDEDDLDDLDDLPAEPGAERASDMVLLHLWSRLNRGRQLASLAVVPAHAGGSGMAAARAIIEVGRLQRNNPIRLIDAEGLRLGGAAQVIREMNASVARGASVVVVVDSVLTNPVGLEVAMAAKSALLCVNLGTTDMASARRTIEMVGKERFVGSVTLKEGA